MHLARVDWSKNLTLPEASAFHWAVYEIGEPGFSKYIKIEAWISYAFGYSFKNAYEVTKTQIENTSGPLSISSRWQSSSKNAFPVWQSVAVEPTSCGS